MRVIYHGRGKLLVVVEVGGGRYARWGDVEGAMWLLVRGAGRRIGGLG